MDVAVQNPDAAVHSSTLFFCRLLKGIHSPIEFPEGFVRKQQKRITEKLTTKQPFLLLLLYIYICNYY